MTPPRILIVFHTLHGQTAKVAARVGDVMRARGATVETHFAEVAPPPDGYDAVVVGDALTVGHYSHPVQDYVGRHASALNEKTSALFQLSMTSANPDARHAEQARHAMELFLQKTGFRPARTALFAGALPYTRYGWFTRRVMRFIVKREGGDTDTRHDHEYTDWDQVEAFAVEVLDALRDSAASTDQLPNNS